MFIEFLPIRRRGNKMNIRNISLAVISILLMPSIANAVDYSKCALAVEDILMMSTEFGLVTLGKDGDLKRKLLGTPIQESKNSGPEQYFFSEFKRERHLPVKNIGEKIKKLSGQSQSYVYLDKSNPNMLKLTRARPEWMPNRSGK
jgi:hypothetical protein